MTQSTCGDSICKNELRRQKARKKAERESIRVRKEKIKSRKDWLDEAQGAVNAWVRWRDRNDGCISCEKPSIWHGQWHASHWRSVGASSATRFNLWNIHKACSVCNDKLSGNLRAYTPRLIIKIGAYKAEWLESQTQIVRHSPEYLKRLRDIFRKRLSNAKKRGEVTQDDFLSREHQSPS